MKKVTTIPPLTYTSRQDPWLDELLDGDLRELGKADWSPRYATVRSAASAIKQAADNRGGSCHVAIRGDSLYVQATSTNGTAKKAAPRKAAAKAKGGAAKASPPRTAKAAAKAAAKAP